MDAFALQIALLFLPGIVWAWIDARYVARQEISTPRLALNAFLFGLIAHATTFLIYVSIDLRYDLASFAPAKGFYPAALSDIVDEIVVSLIVAIGFALLWIYGSTYKVGDESVAAYWRNQTLWR